MMGDLSVVVHRIINRDDAQKAYCCMTEVPTSWPDALCQCRDWVAENLGRYVEGYHLQLGDGEVIGHLYYAPSERALFPYQVETGVGILYCDWVQKRYQGMGLGRQLHEAFLDDMDKLGMKGVLVEATDLEGQMNFRHYQRRGFEIIQRDGNRILLYHPLSQKKAKVQRLPSSIPSRRGKPVEILILNGYMCPYEVSTQLLLRSIVREFGDQVILRDVWLTPETLHQYGVAKGVFINGQQKLSGGETEGAIRQAIVEEF
jgi:GNAT superfamily N-acetyltransferase